LLFQVRRLTVALQACLAERGDMHMIPEVTAAVGGAGRASLSTRSAASAITEQLVLDLHRVRPDFGDELYAYLVALLAAWGQSSWATPRLITRLSGMLRLLSRDESHREALISSGCPDFLLSTISNLPAESPAVTESACCLNNLALRPPSNRAILAQNGACPPLVRLLAPPLKGAGWKVRCSQPCYPLHSSPRRCFLIPSYCRMQST
jgi:hypothetical protein